MNCRNPRCRAPLQPGDKVCPSCGTRVEQADEDGQVATAQASPCALGGMSSGSDVMFRIDRLYILTEDCPGTVRFWVDSTRLGAEARRLRFSFSNPLTGEGFAIRPRGRNEFSVTFPKQERGDFVWYITIEHADNGGRRVFEGEMRLIVGQKKESRKLAEHLAITIQNDIKAGNASDVNLSLNAVDSLNKIVEAAEDPYEALRTLAYGGKRAWTNVELCEANDAEPPPPAPALQLRSPERLTLVCGDEVVQLLSDERVTFGRSRDTTIPIRICGADGRVDRGLNEYNISRHHFAIERSGVGDCVVRDGGDKAPSAYGTRVADVPMAPQGTVLLDAGREVSLEVGRAEVALRMRVTFYRDSQGRAAGFVLDRLDGARQKVCAAWGEVPIADDASVLWNGRCWMLICGGSRETPIPLGGRISIGGRSFDVQPFHQTHLN